MESERSQQRSLAEASYTAGIDIGPVSTYIKHHPSNCLARTSGGPLPKLGRSPQIEKKLRTTAAKG